MSDVDAVAVSKATSDMFIVGIGASAGGLAALEQFFDNMPSDSGMAFIVVQHLSPDFKSLMDDLLARHTKMRVLRVTNGQELEPDSIYLIPPKSRMTISQGRLFLTEKASGPHVDLPIDVFFRSLADDAGRQAIGVILSGTGSDGSRGIVNIRDAGGLVLVQDAESAQFDGMPRSAIATGACDYELPSEEMPSLLMEYKADPLAVKRRIHRKPSLTGGEAEYSEIFFLLKQRFNLDFSKYRATTVGRRIERRMAFRNVASVQDYIALIITDTEEVESLYRDLLIGVTEFFRDPTSFKHIENDVIPQLLRERPAGEEVRVWSSACATGEEAYSLAILFLERAEEMGFKGKITIFATDVHRTSLEAASQGSFDQERMRNVSPDRLKKYFRPEGNRYKVQEFLRKAVVFAPHNLINDPPFTKMDLVTCRNFMIYLKPEVQERVLTLLHFSLRPGGYLFLGSSEGPGKLASEFEVINQPAKLFQKVRDLRLALDIGVGPASSGRFSAYNLSSSTKATVTMDRQLVHDYDELLARHMPPGILVNEQRQVLHYFGDMAPYLAKASGRFENDALKLIHPQIQAAIGTALSRVMKARFRTRMPALTIDDGGSAIVFDVDIDMLRSEKGLDSHYLISFIKQEEKAFAASAPEVLLTPADAMQQRLLELEAELRSAKESLQTTVEELQTTNEELQSTNEELLAANEELQSTNEELHSVNEELYTVNSEFELKNKELTQLNLDHDNLLASIEVGIIFLDKDMRIRRYNDAITHFFKLLPQDVGRPIDHIAYHLANQQQMLEDVRQVLLTGKKIEKEVATRQGRWLMKRVLPFRSKPDTLDGVVLTYTDINRVKDAEERLAAINHELEGMVQERTEALRQTNVRLEREMAEHMQTAKELAEKEQQLDLALTSGNIAWWIWDVRTGEVRFSKEKALMVGYRPEEFPTNVYRICELIHPEDYDRTMRAMKDHLEGRTEKYDVEYRLRRKDVGYEWMLDRGMVTERDPSGRPLRLAGVVVDQQNRKHAELALMQVNRKLSLLSSITRHDVLNKVMIIQGNADLLAKRAGDARDQELLSRIAQAGKDVRELIVFTRSYENLGVEKPRWMLLEGEVMSPTTSSMLKDVKLSVEVKGVEVLADPMLSKVFANLVDNSIRHGERVKKVSVTCSASPQGLVIVYQDDGVGILEDDKVRIFESGVGRNSGFGLFLIKEILDITGMTIRENGVPGEGARFEIIVPPHAYRRVSPS